MILLFLPFEFSELSILPAQPPASVKLMGGVLQPSLEANGKN
jgi:hypothetical protein